MPIDVSYQPQSRFKTENHVPAAYFKKYSNPTLRDSRNEGRNLTGCHPSVSFKTRVDCFRRTYNALGRKRR